MISVNLRPGTKRGKSAALVRRASLEPAQGARAAVKDPLRLVAVIALGRRWPASSAYAFVRTGSRLGADWSRSCEQARAENRRFQDFLPQKRREELVRDSVVSQIATIRRWMATATSGPTSSTRSPARCRRSPGW